MFCAAITQQAPLWVNIQHEWTANATYFKDSLLLQNDCGTLYLVLLHIVSQFDIFHVIYIKGFYNLEKYWFTGKLIHLYNETMVGCAGTR